MKSTLGKMTSAPFELICVTILQFRSTRHGAISSLKMHQSEEKKKKNLQHLPLVYKKNKKGFLKISLPAKHSHGVKMDLFKSTAEQHVC